MVELSTIRDLVAIFGVIAGFSYYVLTVRGARKNQQLQLETRQAQLFTQMISQYSQPSMTESMSFWSHLEITSVEELAELFLNPETSKMLVRWGLYLEGIGVLVKENLLDIKFIAQLIGGDVKNCWEKIAPYMDEFREKAKAPRGFIEFEYLYNEVMKYAETHPELGIQKSEYQVLGRLEG